jgi:hypothetical protein
MQQRHKFSFVWGLINQMVEVKIMDSGIKPRVIGAIGVN